MQIKHPALAPHLQKHQPPLYVLIGQDNYLVEDAVTTIKTAIKATHECDEKTLSVQSADDWNTLIEEANSYSLFADAVLISVFFDKKTIDAAGKKILTSYLKAVNSKCFIIIRAPNVPAKQLLWLASENQVLVVISYPMNADTMKQWIAMQFKKNNMPIAPQVPDLIYQYTQGNMLACAQVIEKTLLSNPTATQISNTLALEHLSDQCEHGTFELVEACLMGQSDKAIQILRQAANNKTESTLVLWMLTQEVRLLGQLLYAVQQRTDFKTACSALKIWPQRISMYQITIKRMQYDVVQALLHYCQTIDERIKSSMNTQVWNALENLALSICLGRLIGEACKA